MKRFSDVFGSRRTSDVLVVILVLTSMIWSPGALLAQEEDEKSLGDLETTEAASMREATYKELAKAQEAAEAENYSAALETLNELGEEELNNYERAQMLNLYAYIYYAQDQMARAISTYEQLLQQPELPEALQTSTTYTLSQLYFSEEKWQQSIDMLESWMSLTKDENLNSYEMMAQAYYQMEQYRKALAPARKVIEMTKAEGKPVNEHSYLLLRVLHYELGEFNQVASILQELIAKYPKKQYWIQLASIYGEMDNQRKQLNTLELAYLQGFLVKDNEILTLVSLLLNNDLYLRAGKILAKALDDGVVPSTFEHWRLLAQAWTMAQEDERAIPALTRAAGLSSDGKMDVILAQTYMNLDRWNDAVEAVRAGLGKGGLDRPDQAQVMLGQALFYLENFDEAQAAFAAAQSDRRSRQLAAQWISYIESEKDRIAQLAAALE